jgi:hypothetical protein
VIDKTYVDLRSLRRAHESPRLFDVGLTSQRAGPRGEKLFSCTALNRTLLVKHTLNKKEREDVQTQSHWVTKLIIPIDESDLSMGGYAAYLDEIGTRKKLIRCLKDSSGYENFSEDMRKLTLLAHTPMFDPFLIRERFRSAGIMVEDECFGIDVTKEKHLLTVTHSHIEELFIGATNDVGLSAKIADGFCNTIFSIDALDFAKRLNSFFLDWNRDC